MVVFKYARPVILQKSKLNFNGEKFTVVQLYLDESITIDEFKEYQDLEIPLGKVQGLNKSISLDGIESYKWDSIHVLNEYLPSILNLSGLVAITPQCRVLACTIGYYDEDTNIIYMRNSTISLYTLLTI